MSTGWAVRRDAAGRWVVVRWFDSRGHEAETLRAFAAGRAGLRSALALYHRATGRYVSPAPVIHTAEARSEAPARPAPLHRGDCEACGAPLPEARTRPRRFCSNACRQRAHRKADAA